MAEWSTLLHPSLQDRYPTACLPTHRALLVLVPPEPGSACSAGGTVCDNVPYQTSYPPGQCDVDAVFFTVSTAGTASVNVRIRPSAPVTVTASFAGLFHSSVPFDGQTGAVVISVTSNAKVLGPVTRPAITTTCQSEGVNWNAWVGGS